MSTVPGLMMTLTIAARHYSYECKASTQERPYISRPSRTQQLLNPKLVPKLTSDVPDALQKTKGLADEELAKREAERAKKRELERDEDDLDEDLPKRKRSASFDSHPGLLNHLLEEGDKARHRLAVLRETSHTILLVTTIDKVLRALPDAPGMIARQSGQDVKLLEMNLRGAVLRTADVESTPKVQADRHHGNRADASAQGRQSGLEGVTAVS
ncbi:Uu.00g099590.m01.CDS01 [Anthostomella pinea]|uniref:Uu.00g099590.m01.CDS01 n=1 Tax=Anthostomella pinea TaxID=933095 RepID=A0AAI8VCS7_9PEZI|nr:Uu.00g099590.m01.CDS01 [Anthostomella pinea]